MVFPKSPFTTPFLTTAPAPHSSPSLSLPFGPGWGRRGRRKEGRDFHGPVRLRLKSGRERGHVRLRPPPPFLVNQVIDCADTCTEGPELPGPPVTTKLSVKTRLYYGPGRRRRCRAPSEFLLPRRPSRLFRPLTPCRNRSLPFPGVGVSDPSGVTSGQWCVRCDGGETDWSPSFHRPVPGRVRTDPGTGPDPSSTPSLWGPYHHPSGAKDRDPEPREHPDTSLDRSTGYSGKVKTVPF